MKLWKIVLFALIAIASSCSIQKRPQIQITHVLAVTHEGDTLKIPIDVIRPINYRIINYSSGYGYNSWYTPYHNTYYNYNYSKGYSRSSNGSGSNTSGNTNQSVPTGDRPSSKPVVPKGVTNKSTNGTRN